MGVLSSGHAKPIMRYYFGSDGEALEEGVEMKSVFARMVGLFTCAAKYWSSDGASTTGAALAFFCAFSIAPLLVILLTLAGWIVGTTAAYTQIGNQLVGLFGPSTAKILLDAVKSSEQVQGIVATLISIVTLAIGATTVLAALDDALKQIFKGKEREPTGWRGWLRTRFLSFGFILALGFLLLVSLTISTGLSSVRQHAGLHNAAVLVMIHLLDTLLSLVLVSGLFALIFRYMPAGRLPWRVVGLGGVLTAILFDVGRWGVGLYLAHSTQPSAFGAAASFAAMLLWLYYTAQIFLYGAEFTACLGGIRSESTAEGGLQALPAGVPSSHCRVPN